ncbi:MAG TPA: AMP-binding protein [Methylomirabilota bacterium]|nr:AMP-binding protein [Methylomirabilota bacterium]
MLATDAIRQDSRATARDVLGIVSGLVGELGGRSGDRPVGLDDVLDRDLGIGSLERVELLVRLEQRYGVRLPDAVMAEAVTPRDLVTAIQGAEPPGVEAVLPPRAPVGEATPAPAGARSLVEALDWHAHAAPERVHIFLRDEDGRERPITYGSLWQRAQGVAASLRERRIGRGDTVAIMLRTEEAFFHAFFGVLLAGAVPVPIYPPFRRDLIEDYARRQVGILRNAAARTIITFPEAMRVATLLRSRVPSLWHVVAAPDLLRPAGSFAGERGGAADPALIQYTSGSTGEPKGVLLSHGNLLENIRAIGEAIRVSPDDVAVSWLPLYHDMGLIGSWLGALYFGIPIAILSPLAFLARPARWLQAIHAHRATVSAAPNFAFDLCARRLTDEETGSLDLSSWRLALNGSEPVSPATIDRFTRRFGPRGFRASAMCPVYGLAEASVALTIPPPRAPRVDTIARTTFQEGGRALAASPDERAPLSFVSCGPPLPRHEIRVVDRDGRLLGERVEGRIEFRGPSVTEGYWRNPAATRAARHDGWMDSGDLGYWADGELYVTGRQKDLIIKAGRNLYPQEVEDIVGAVPGIRKGCVAAFGVHDPSVGTERLVVVAETRTRPGPEREQLRAAVLDRVVAALGIPADVVVIADPHAVLKTSSGKVRRSATRALYLAGGLGRPGRTVAAQWARLLLRDVGARAIRAAGRLPALVRAGYLGSLFLLTVPPLWLGVRLAPSDSAADRMVRGWCRLILAASGCSLRLEGAEHLTVHGPLVLAANHGSYLDVVVLLAALPVPFRFVAKQELVTAPVVGRIIRKVGHLTVERGPSSRSVTDALRVTRALRDGLSVLVFPEGTFVRAPGILPFRLGGFKAAVETGCPVIPVTIRGTREILPDGSWLPRPGPVTLAVGAPIVPEHDGWPAMVRLRDRTRAEIIRRSTEPAVDHHQFFSPQPGDRDDQR